MRDETATFQLDPEYYWILRAFSFICRYAKMSKRNLSQHFKQQRKMTGEKQEKISNTNGAALLVFIAS